MQDFGRHFGKSDSKAECFAVCYLPVLGFLSLLLCESALVMQALHARSEQCSFKHMDGLQMQQQDKSNQGILGIWFLNQPFRKPWQAISVR